MISLNSYTYFEAKVLIIKFHALYEFCWLKVFLFAQFGWKVDINIMLPNNPIILNSPQPQSETDRIKKVVSKSGIKALSIVQIVCAVIAIITQIILLGRQVEGIADIGAGMWTGFFFGVTGLIGLFASQKPSKCK